MSLSLIFEEGMSPPRHEPIRGRDKGRKLHGEVDRHPIEVRNKMGGSRVVLTCDHAGRATV